MKVLKDKRTRVLILIMSALVLLAITIAHFWFKFENESADPRVVEANKLYAGYNQLARDGEFGKVLQLLDTLEEIYLKIPHYANSYEVGVLYNNRAAVCITLAIAPNNNDSVFVDSLFSVAESFALRSLEIYNQWFDKWSDLDEHQIKQKLIPYFNTNDPVFQGKNVDRYIRKRAQEIEEAKHETHRRLSASHTNLGIIYRHRDQYDDAVKQYLIALELWDDNLAAENNLNVMLNKPLKKRSTFRKIFPKDRRQR